MLVWGWVASSGLWACCNWSNCCLPENLENHQFTPWSSSLLRLCSMSQNNPESSPLNSSEINKMKVLEWLSQSLDLKRLTCFGMTLNGQFVVENASIWLNKSNFAKKSGTRFLHSDMKVLPPSITHTWLKFLLPKPGIRYRVQVGLANLFP